MNAPNEEKPLSVYLKGLVDHGSLPDYVAEILNRLPDWKQQRKGAEMWKSNLGVPALEVVTRLENISKGIEEEVDFLHDADAILIRKPFLYVEQSLEEYIETLRDGLQQYVPEISCPVCGKPMGTGPSHIDCARYERLRNDWSLLGDLIQVQKEQPGDQERYREGQDRIWELNKALRSGFFKDGTPWNAPHTYTDMRNAAITQKNDESNGGSRS